MSRAKPGPKPRDDSLTDAPVVAVKIPAHLLRELDGRAEEHRLTRAESIRSAIEQSLEEKNMAEALEVIHDVAAPALTGTKQEMRDALEKIVSVARYRFDVLGSHERPERSSGTVKNKDSGEAEVASEQRRGALANINCRIQGVTYEHPRERFKKMIATAVYGEIGDGKSIDVTTGLILKHYGVTGEEAIREVYAIVNELSRQFKLPVGGTPTGRVNPTRR